MCAYFTMPGMYVHVCAYKWKAEGRAEVVVRQHILHVQILIKYNMGAFYKGSYTMCCFVGTLVLFTHEQPQCHMVWTH